MKPYHKNLLPRRPLFSNQCNSSITKLFVLKVSVGHLKRIIKKSDVLKGIVTDVLRIE